MSDEQGRVSRGGGSGACSAMPPAALTGAAHVIVRLSTKTAGAAPSSPPNWQRNHGASAEELKKPRPTTVSCVLATWRGW